MGSKVGLAFKRRDSGSELGLSERSDIVGREETPVASEDKNYEEGTSSISHLYI